MKPVSFAPAGGRLNLITARNFERAGCGFGAGLKTSGSWMFFCATTTPPASCPATVRMISPVRDPGAPSLYSASALTTT